MIYFEAKRANRVLMVFVIPVFIIVSVLLAAPQIAIGLVILLVGAGLPMIANRLLRLGSSLAETPEVEQKGHSATRAPGSISKRAYPPTRRRPTISCGPQPRQR